MVTEIKLCPRCKGHGGTLKDARDGICCYLCDGHARVFDFGDSMYAPYDINVIDPNDADKDKAVLY